MTDTEFKKEQIHKECEEKNVRFIRLQFCDINGAIKNKAYIKPKVEAVIIPTFLKSFIFILDTSSLFYNHFISVFKFISMYLNIFIKIPDGKK